MSIGDRVRAERARLKLTQRQLAAQANVSPGQVGHIEAGTRTNLEMGSLAPIAAALGVSVDWLLTGEGPRERRPEQAVELDGDLDARIAEVGAALGAPAHVIRAAHDLRGARGTAGLTDEDIRGMLRSLAAADELAQLKAVGGLQRGAPVEVDDDDLRPRRKK